MSQLPPIWIEGRPLALPLAEPSASALLNVLLLSPLPEETGPAGALDPAAAAAAHRLTAEETLAAALALDPALALWAAAHHAQSAPADAPVPSIAELARFVSAGLTRLLAERSGILPSRPPCFVSSSPPEVCAK